MNSPAQSTSVFGNDNIIVQASGSGVNVTVQSGRPYLRLTQFEKRTRLAVRDNSEAALLSAYRADVVPLIGRDREMNDFRRWLDDPRELSVRVLVGAGGRGKTRLGLERRALLRRTDGSPVSPARRNSTAFAARTALSSGDGTSRSSSSSITPPVAPNKSAIGSANSSTRRSRIGPSCGWCCWSVRPIARSAGSRPSLALATTTLPAP